MIENTPKPPHLIHDSSKAFFQWNALRLLIIKHCMIMLHSLLICIFDLPQILLGRWHGTVQKRIWKEEASRRFLGCLKCQPGRIYVLLADINVSVVFHEVNNEKVRPCPQYTPGGFLAQTINIC